MRNKATIAVWGCIVCSNVWMSRADLSSALPFAFAAMWLSFAGLLILEPDAPILAAQPAPAGWRLVPVKPTPAMLQDGSMHCGMGMFGSDDEARKVYTAMLDAAPAAPGGAQ